MRVVLFMILLIPIDLWGKERPCVVKQFPLDERSVYEIPIGVDVPTTILFPGPITSLSGANIAIEEFADAEDLEKGKVSVLLSYNEGRYFFAVRAVLEAAEAAVNVIYKNRTYVLSFYESEEPMRSVKFYENGMEFGPGSSRKPVTPETLLGVLDRAKSYGFLKTQYPEAVQQLDIKRTGAITRYKQFDVVTEEVMRFDPEDTLVFKIKLRNKTDHEIYYQPQRLGVRVAENIYYASISDASGIIPPQAESLAFFAITGKPGGGRANLSVKNTFSIIVLPVEDISLIVPNKC